jgi:hypothetical protein
MAALSTAEYRVKGFFALIASGVKNPEVRHMLTSGDEW